MGRSTCSSKNHPAFDNCTPTVACIMRRMCYMTDTEFQVAGGNASTKHHDFMIGSSGMDAIGIHADGREETILESGNWVLPRD